MVEFPASWSKGQLIDAALVKLDNFFVPLHDEVSKQAAACVCDIAKLKTDAGNIRTGQVVFLLGNCYNNADEFIASELESLAGLIVVNQDDVKVLIEVKVAFSNIRWGSLYTRGKTDA